VGRDLMTDELRRALEGAGRADSSAGAITRYEVPSGAAIEEDVDEQGEARVALRAPGGGVLLELRPSDGRCRIHAPSIEIAASNELRLSGRSVRVEAERSLVMSAGDTAISAQPRHLSLLAEEIAVTSQQTSWTTKGFRLVGDVVETRARRIVQRAEEMESRARLLVEKTWQSLREAEDLAQTKAQRVRLVAEDTLRAFGRRTLLKAREDMKLRGERIYLD
jgi:hypothetical protein